MSHSAREILRRLGAGESIASVCHWLGWQDSDFTSWWQRAAGCRAPQREREVRRAVVGDVSVTRDHWGIPTITASRTEDLWFGFGYAQAQDRLFQLDYLRRKGAGTLAEVLGPEGLANDRLSRTVGLRRIAEAEWPQLPVETQRHLEWFTAGVNAWMAQAGDLIPIEFDLLDYRPAPWTPLDSLVIEVEFRWYLTGRFPVICMPELAKRVLGEGPLYREFCRGEADQEAIVPPSAYATLGRQLPAEAVLPLSDASGVGQVLGSGDGTGSNNWVVAGKHTRSGRPMVASDPHIAIEAVSCWYEACLRSDDVGVAGAAYVGMPAIIVGRTTGVAWGITNNICSLRDLYQERTHPDHPGCFLYDGHWEPAQQRVEEIPVRGAERETLVIRTSRHGPVVDAVLPPPADRTGPVTLRWLGASAGGWLTALLAMNRAQTVAEFRAAVEPWYVPTFNLVVADTQGAIAMQSVGRIPWRQQPERGYRAGWDPAQQWLGLIPFAGLPCEVNPERGWLVTANNRLAGDDYPYPLAGTWVSGHRAQRIRQLIEERIARVGPSGTPGLTLDDFRDIQHDTLSLRAVECVPSLVAALADEPEPVSQEAVVRLQTWNRRVEAHEVGPTLFNVFFTYWALEVAAARFPADAVEFLARQAEGVASRLLAADPLGWFAEGQRLPAIRRAWRAALAELQRRLGPQPDQWIWGNLHRLPMRHVLSGRGDLSQLLDQPGGPAKGDMVTVCNSGSGPDWCANTGAGYRCIVDLAADHLWAVDGQSQSGHPATTHYADQFLSWEIGEYHSLSLRAAPGA